MKIWIRSQDKLKLCLVDNIKIVDYTELKKMIEKSDYAFILNVASIEENLVPDGCGITYNEICLGVYNSKERALEILNDINSHILDKNIFACCSGLLTPTSKNAIDEIKQILDRAEQIAVYEMPNE